MKSLLNDGKYKVLRSRSCFNNELDVLIVKKDDFFDVVLLSENLEILSKFKLMHNYKHRVFEDRDGSFFMVWDTFTELEDAVVVFLNMEEYIYGL